MSKLSKKELETLQALQNDFTKSKIALGELELQKAQVLEAIAKMKLKFAEQEKILADKYGSNSVINMQTGEVTEKKE